MTRLDSGAEVVGPATTVRGRAGGIRRADSFARSR